VVKRYVIKGLDGAFLEPSLEVRIDTIESIFPGVVKDVHR